MRFARLQTADGIANAVASGDSWRHIEDPFAGTLAYTGAHTPADDGILLAPVRPRVIVGIAHNRGNNDHPLPMQAWHKSPHSVANPGEIIPVRRDIGTVNIEGELAVVIGRQAYQLTESNAFDHVFGYTVANDVTNIDQVPRDEKNFQAKSGINYTPLGPWIETEIADPENVATEVIINGRVVGQSGSFNLPSSVVASLVYVTSWLRLETGDVVLTGAPNTFFAAQPGDRVEITLAGIGTLTNTIG